MTGQGWIVLAIVLALFCGYGWLTYVSEQAWRRAQVEPGDQTDIDPYEASL